MKAQTSFADRIAGIEARASGKAPKLPVMAPMVGEDLRETASKKRGVVSGFIRNVILPAAVIGIGAGLYAGELIAMLPPDIAADLVTQPGPLGEFLRDQMSPEHVAQLGLGLPVSTPPAVTD